MAYRIFISSVQREFAKECTAIVNAICHRDYTSNASVQVMLFPDRLEVTNPGPLPKGMTVAKLKRRHKSIPVNPLLAQAMYLRGYIERVGSGTGDIIESCREKGLPPPVWENDDDGFTVTLRRVTSGTSEERSLQTTQKTTPETTIETTIENVPNRQPVGLDVGLDVGLEHNIIREIQTQSQVRMSEIAVRYHVSKRTVERVFSKLSREGRIVRIGGKRFGHWEVIG